MLPLYIIGTIISLLLNSTVSIIVLKKGKRMKHIDLLMFSMAFSDIAQAGIGYSIEIYAVQFSPHVNRTTCDVSGFAVTFLALVSIFHLVGLSVERCLVLKFPTKAREKLANRWVALYIIVPSWLYSLLWATLPLVGFSSYERIKSLNDLCLISLSTSDNEATIFAYLLLVCCYLIPVITIATSSVVTVREMRRNTVRVRTLGVGEKQMAARRKEEIKQAVMALVLTATFILVWTPYAACVFVSTTKGSIDATLFTYSAIIGKTSALYNPIIFLLLVREFRREFLILLKCVLCCRKPTS